MKILKLEFENLNSLYGHWCIDFTDPAFQEAGLFAITGPTGGGKSTILDAMVLALYGRTPRTNVTKENNELFSWGARSCFSELTFQVGGTKYISRFEQSRSTRKNSEGILRNYDLILIEDGRKAALKKAALLERVAEITGLKFDQFCRTVLLPQGNFASFLRADADERAPILEQITGTGIYRDLARRAFERNRSEQHKLELAEAEAGALNVLSEEAEAEVRRRMAEAHQVCVEADAFITDLRGQLNTWTRLEEARNDGVLAQKNAEASQAAWEAFAPVLTELAQAQRALALEAEFAELCASRTAERLARERKTLLIERLKTLQIQLEEAQSALKNASDTRTRTHLNWETQSKIWREVRALDVAITTGQSQWSHLEKQILPLRTQTAEWRALAGQCFASLASLREEASAVEAFLHEHEADRDLGTSLGALQVELQEMKNLEVRCAARKQEVEVLAAQVEAGERRLVAETEALAQLQNLVRTTSEQLETARQTYTTLLENRSLEWWELRVESLGTEVVLLRRIAGYEEERKHLRPQEACPLCGALLHPYVEHLPEAPAERERDLADVREKLRRLRGQVLAVQNAERNCAEAANRLEVAENRSVALRESLEELKKNASKAKNNLNQEAQVWLERRKILRDKWLALGVVVSEDDDWNAAWTVLERRLTEYRKRRDRAESLRALLHAKELEVEKAQAAAGQGEADLARQEEALHAQRLTWERQKEERSGLFGNTSCDAAESALHHELEQADLRYEACKSALESCGSRKVVLEEELVAAETNLRAGIDAGLHAEQRFQEALALQRFGSEAEFLAARRESDWIEVSRRKGETLKEAVAVARNTEVSCRERLVELEKNQPREKRSELEPALTALQEKRDAALKAEAQNQEQLQENQRRIQELGARRVQLEAQRRECERWQKLNYLIGDSQGNKFSRFAQGITFAEVLRHANRELANLTGRYTLVLDRDEPLKVNLADAYQLNAIRSCDNLSGGESFLVSLALALGLASIAGENIRVDSLFLDEGFGTLDQETLERALSALSGLHRQGKLVGIISHVAEISEILPVRIEVIPCGNGRSRLAGPGVTGTQCKTENLQF